jgi:hypothetical protein
LLSFQLIFFISPLISAAAAIRRPPPPLFISMPAFDISFSRRFSFRAIDTLMFSPPFSPPLMLSSSFFLHHASIIVSFASRFSRRLFDFSQAFHR